MYSLELPCWPQLMAVPSQALIPLSSGTWETVFMGRCSGSSSCSTLRD